MSRLMPEQRTEVTILRQEGHSVMALARRFNVSRSTIQRMAQRQRETGQLTDHDC